MRVETKEFTKTQLFRFREFPVYKAVRELRIELKALSKKKFPKTEQYALTSQLWTALDSILLNTALTSVNEVVACLDAAMDDGYISTEEQEKSLSKLDNISRQLKAFSSKVRNSGS